MVFRRSWLPILTICLMVVPAAEAQQASGSVAVDKDGTIAPTSAIAYIVRDGRNARTTRIEILLSDVALSAADVQTAFDPHMIAINLPALNNRNYVLLWVGDDGLVSMNATFSRTMTQYLESTRGGGLKAEWTTRTPGRIAGRVFSPAPIKTMDGTTYRVDLTFAADTPVATGGQPLPTGGGDPGKALTAFLAAASAKNWVAIKAASSPNALTMFDKSYNSAEENAEGAADLVKAWISTDKMTVTGGQIQGEIAILDVEGEMFPGQRSLSRVRMVKSGTVWQFDRAARAGMVP